MEPRLTPLSVAERTDDQRRLLAGTGELNIFTTFARHPRLFDVFIRFAGRLLNRSTLPALDREILILRTAYRCGSEYEWVHHVEIAGELGMPAETITQLRTEDCTDPALALLIRAADQLTLDHDLDDETWTGLRERYADEQLIELCMLVGNYAMIAGVLKSLRVPLERPVSSTQD